MEHSIQQIAQELVRKITEKAIKNGITDIDTLSSQVLSDCKAAAREIIQTITEELNRQIRADKAGRKARGLVLKEKDRPRQLLTELGTLELKRDYYQEKDRGRYRYVLDEMIGLNKYERVGRQVCAKLVNYATQVSYAKSSAAVTESKVSRQTVRNQILRTVRAEKEIEGEQRKVKELHVYADEDHVHMQKAGKEKGKQNQIVPLVIVTEGIEKEMKGRNRTKRPMWFVNESFDGKMLWKSVSGYIAKAYDVESLEKIYVHGDGGQWIESGLEEYSQKAAVMDGYHLEKRMKELSRCFMGQNVRQRLNEAISADDQERARKILRKLEEKATTEKQVKKAKEFGTYLFHHWGAIWRRKTEPCCGSCTEGQVSHVLAERFSRDPAGWSKECLGKLSVLRVYTLNGGKITKEIFGKEEEKREWYHEYAERFVEEHLRGASDWSMFEKEPLMFNSDSGTQTLIKGMGRQARLC